MSHNCIRSALVCLTIVTVSCGGAMPTTPTPATNLSGTWSATTADSQGTATMRLTLAQSNDALVGTVTFNYAGGNDCNACHRQTSGTVTGKVFTDSATFVMDFPAGNPASPTPLCATKLQGATSALDPTHLSAGYFGSDTCMGAFSGGVMNLTRTSTSASR